MIVLQIISIISSLIVVAVYLFCTPSEFHWANMLLFAPIMIPAILLGAWGSVIVSTAFGIVAAIKIYRGE